MAITKQVTVEIDGEEATASLPAVWVICSHCEGTGGSSAYLGAFTASEWGELDDDFQQDYMSGRLDRPCDHCDGAGKTLQIDVARCASLEHRRILRAKRADDRDLAEMRACERAERAMGA